MNRRDYERLQLEIFANEYEQKGYDVRYETQVHENIKYRFDAIATKDDADLVIIEIVNKRRDQESDAILHALKEVQAKYENTRVDFRYIDVDQGALQFAREYGENIDVMTLSERLRTRLPDTPSKLEDASPAFFTLWRSHVLIIRSFGLHLNLSSARYESILEVYNELLQRKVLRAPEAEVHDRYRDLFDLYDQLRGSMEGGKITGHAYDELYWHATSVRRQIEQHLNPEPIRRKKR